jgi:hypothetical protein
MEEFLPLVEQLRARLGDQLRWVALFGSCLSSQTRRAGSIPDLFASVDDLELSLVRLDAKARTRWLARHLPPLTLAFSGPSGSIAAKLNLISPEQIRTVVATQPDLYVVGRLSKHTLPLFERDADAALERARLVLDSSKRMVELAFKSLPRSCSVEDVVRRCVGLSFASEPRPEWPEKIAALFDAFAPVYLERLGPLVLEHARQLGIHERNGVLNDERDENVRRSEARSLRVTLFRSKLRTLMRWPKQMLVYRGWLPYVLGKLRRARSIAATAPVRS